MEEQPKDDRPAAYDAEGRPLYYHPEPPVAQAPDQTPPNQAIPISDTKTTNDDNQTTPDSEAAQKHDESVIGYPDLNVGPNEYVVIDVERSIIGLVLIWFIVCIAFLACIIATVLVSHLIVGSPYVLLIGFTLAIACFSGGLIATYVYNQNYFIVTNERVIAKVQTTPFSYLSQNVELEHIEDCSYSQSTVLQNIFGYGSIRLSTVGDEQTYRFNFVSRPGEQFKVINRVVQAVDEGEPTRYQR